jgi:hypothetical protein
MSALPKHMYSDPALHVKFEHERNPCLKCKYLDMLWDKQVCVIGQKVGNGCVKFTARGAA